MGDSDDWVLGCASCYRRILTEELGGWVASE